MKFETMCRIVLNSASRSWRPGEREGNGLGGRVGELVEVGQNLGPGAGKEVGRRRVGELVGVGRGLGRSRASTGRVGFGRKEAGEVRKKMEVGQRCMHDDHY